jgi:hypothetical protein
MADWNTGYAIQGALSRCNCTLNPKPTLNCNVSKITIIVLSRAILQQHTEAHTGSFSCNYTKHTVTSTSHSLIPFKFCTCTQLCNRKHRGKKKKKAPCRTQSWSAIQNLQIGIWWYTHCRLEKNKKIYKSIRNRAVSSQQKFFAVWPDYKNWMNFTTKSGFQTVILFKLFQQLHNPFLPSQALSLSLSVQPYWSVKTGRN